jgi:HD-GYP domain-containing protein (c-di-GMP phosphodiesterase class II)
MKNSNEEHYTRSVTELADIIPVITSQEVFSNTGMKLVNRGIRLDSSFFERLGRHNILPPLEQCLIVENGVNNAAIVALAQQLLEIEPSLARMAGNVPNPAVLFEVLQAVTLSDPVVFLLTLARERRPRLLTHSVTVALICIYLGIRLSLARQKLIELASAGLFHDLGELRIDARLFAEEARPTPEERAQIYTHPATSQRILLNSSVYSLEIINAVMRHHESIDGSGYPFALRGIEMGQAAQILSIAEVAGTKLEQEALDGVPRLEIALKLNMQKFDAKLLGYLSVLFGHEPVLKEYEYESGNINEYAAASAPQLSVPYIHNQINNIGLAIVYWQRLLGNTPVRPRSPSAYIQQRLNDLSLASREAGINPADKFSVTAGIEHDEKSLIELKQINQEALQQITEIVFEVQRRWPAYQADRTPVGMVVNGWMEHMQGLLLELRERKL